MDAGKLDRIQFPLQLSDGVVDTVGLALGNRVGKLVLGVEMTHANEVKKPKPIAEARRNAAGELRLALAQRVRDLAEQGLQIRLRRRPRAAQPLHFVQSAFQCLWFNRLEQVIDGVFAERLQRILVVSCGENHNGLARQPRQNFKAIQPRHLDIEKAYVRRIPGKRCHGFLGLGGEAGHFNTPRVVEQATQALERQRLIIHEIDTKLHGRGRTISTTE